MSEPEELNPEEERELEELRESLVKSGEVKARFVRRMSVALFVTSCLVIAASIWMTAVGRPFPSYVFWGALIGAVIYGVMSLLHLSVLSKRPIRVKAKAGRDGGEIDVEA